MISKAYIFIAKHQLILLIVLAIGLNVNTLFHQYVLDDCVVLTENHLVQQGVKGIPELLSTDYVKGYSPQQNILTAARYRPLSLILFAVEYQFFSANPLVSHLISVLLFALLIVLLHILLNNYLFKEQHPLLAFVTCLLFAMHPIHTEVIANVKSRDEIIAFILLVLSLISILKYIATNKKAQLITSLLCFLLALLTKETAVTFIAIVPLLIYFFLKQTVKKSLKISIPFLLIFVFYLFLRYIAVGFKHYPVNDVTNAPYLYSTVTEAFATKVFILLKYMLLLFIPHPLSIDYGYNQLPYISITSIPFIFAFVLISGIISWAVYLFRRRNIISFSILYFFITISVATNFIIDLGAPLAERMLFQPSLAYCIIIAFILLKVVEKSKLFSVSILIVLVILFSIKTVARNSDWHSNETIIIADVNNSPNCSRLNLYACERYIIKANAENNPELKAEYLDKAIAYGEKSLAIHAKFAYVYQRLGFAYFNKQNYTKASELWLQAAKLDPDNMETKQWLDNLSALFYKRANGFMENNNMDEAITNYTKSTEANNKNIEAFYNLGGCYFMKNDMTNATKYWNKVKELDSNFPIKKEDFNHL